MVPVLSIVIPNWNTRDHLANCLASLDRTAGDLDIETIVVDNGSSDGSVSMVRERFRSVHLIENETNRGFAAACNQGLGRAAGRYLLLLNSDTLVQPGSLRLAIDFMDAHPDVGLIGGKILNPDGSLQFSSSDFPGIVSVCLSATTLGERIFGPHYPSRSSRKDGMERPIEVECIAGAFMFARRSVWESVGGLSEHYKLYSEDTDWCYRIAHAGLKVVYVPQIEIIHIGGASTSQHVGDSEVELYRAKVQFLATHYGAFRAAAVRAMLWMIFLLRGLACRVLAVSSTATDQRERWQLRSATCRRVRSVCLDPAALA